MSFIIFDLEFNQDVSSFRESLDIRTRYPFEIIQIGAVKLNMELNDISLFNRYVRPTFYTKINSFVSELTGIRTEQLLSEEPFPEIYKAYIEFIDDQRDSIFCTWGMSDLTELFKNVEYHKLDNTLLPRRVINAQPFVSKQLNLSRKKLLRLQHAVEMFNIPITYPFHNALYDAYYTAEVFKKIYNPSIKPIFYDPSHTPTRPIKRKQVIDTEKLLEQFEKMYARKMTQEEQEMILLAYKMGRTHQFLKDQKS